MVVLYKNQLFSLDMTYFLFQSIKRSDPDYEVELFSLVDSTYKKLDRVAVRDVEDWSVARNLQALGQN